MNPQFSKPPVFLHSLFRSGSTYLFEVFRRSAENYWCYQEPLNELLLNVDSRPDELLKVSAEMSSLLRHPKLDKPYFWEFHEIRNEIAGLFRKRFCYDDFFPTDDYDFTELRAYLGALILNARGQPVFQCCRSFGRATFVKCEVKDAIHIYLWRNPRDQWWSYKVASFFDTTNLLILNANNPPSVINDLRSTLAFEEFHDADISREHAHFDQHRLPPEQSYVLFYTLWCYGLLKNRQFADLMISIDSLSDSDAYRERVRTQIQGLDIKGIDFSDCRVPQSHYSHQEVDFFAKIEERVHESFISHGFGETEIDAIQALRYEHAPAATRKGKLSAKQEVLIAEAARARGASLRLERELVSHLVERRQLEVHLHAKEKDCLTTQAVLQTKEREVRNIELPLRARKFGRQQLEGGRVVYEAELHRARASLQSKDVEYGNLLTALEASEFDRQQLRAALQSKNVDCRDLEITYQTMEAERNNLEAALGISESERQRLIAVIHTKDTEMNERENKIALLKTRIQQLQSEAEILESRSNQWQISTRNLTKDIQNVYASRSWRITEPLRAMRRFLGADAAPVFDKKSTKMRMKGFLRVTKSVINKVPVLKHRIAAWLDHFPGFRLRLQLALAPGIETPDKQAASQNQVAVVGALPTKLMNDEVGMSTPSLIGHIDSPSSVFILSGPIRFSGWVCHRDFKVTRLTIKYGFVTKECRYGLSRQDVHSVYSAFANSLMSGFDVTLMVSPGKNQVSLEATLENGICYRFLPDQIYAASPTLRLSRAGDEASRTLIAQTNVEAFMERAQEGSCYLELAEMGGRRRSII